MYDPIQAVSTNALAKSVHDLKINEHQVGISSSNLTS